MVRRPHPSIDRAIRVNYAVELAATKVCAGQIAVLGGTKKLKVGNEVDLSNVGNDYRS